MNKLRWLILIPVLLAVMLRFIGVSVGYTRHFAMGELYGYVLPLYVIDIIHIVACAVADVTIGYPLKD